MTNPAVPPLPPPHEAMSTLGVFASTPHVARAWCSVNDELVRLRKIEKAVRALRALEYFSIEPVDYPAWEAVDQTLSEALGEQP